MCKVIFVSSLRVFDTYFSLEFLPKMSKNAQDGVHQFLGFHISTAKFGLFKKMKIYEK